MRHEIQALEAPDLFFVNGRAGDREKHVRQKRRDGQGFVAVSSDTATVASSYLADLQKVLTPELLKTVDAKLDELCNEETRDAAAATLLNNHSADAVVQAGGIVTRLAALVQKRRLQLSAQLPDDAEPQLRTYLHRLRAAAPDTTAAALWPRIVARTDQLYHAVEELLPVFPRIIDAIADRASVPPTGRQVAQVLKDPVRVHEKAIDDYIFDYDDFDDRVVIPESCVVDVLRCRLICPGASEMMAVLELLRDGFEGVVNGEKATLTLLRIKNKMGSGDPTHFRNVLCNLRLNYGTLAANVEVQVHHEQILQFNNESHAHGYYEYFRSLLGSSFSSELDTMLERALIFIEEVRGVPVLLSCLVLIFEERDRSKQANQLLREVNLLPGNRLELYDGAIKARLRQVSRNAEHVAALLDMVRRIAYANYEHKRREFTTANVEEALSGKPAAWALWVEQCCSGNDEVVPLIKTLEDPGGRRQNGLYQFKHLSFQEALAAQFLISSPELTDKIARRLTEFLTDPYNRNLICIGGGRLGDALGQRQERWDMKGKLSADDLPALTHVLRENTYVRSLSLAHCDITRKGADPMNAYQLVDVLPQTNLTSVDLRGTNLTYHGGNTDHHAPMSRLINNLVFTHIEQLHVEGKYSLPIKELNGEYRNRVMRLESWNLTHLSALFIADAIRVNPSLCELWLDRNKLGLRGALLIGKALTENRTLRFLSLNQNLIEDYGVKALCDYMPRWHAVETLRLECNDLGLDSCVCLARVLKLNTALRALHLGRNDFGADGAAALIEGIMSNEKLSFLSVDKCGPERCGLSEESVTELIIAMLGRSSGDRAPLTEEVEQERANQSSVRWRSSLSCADV